MSNQTTRRKFLQQMGIAGMAMIPALKIMTMLPADNDGHFTSTGIDDNATGVNIILYGPSHTTYSDLKFRAVETEIWVWDNSECVWEF